MASWDGWAYGYDIENRLISAIKGGDTVDYTYDPLGRMASQTHNGTVTTYLYDGVEPIDFAVVSPSSLCSQVLPHPHVYSTSLHEQDTDGTGKVLRRYINGAGVDERMVFLKYDTGTGAITERHYYDVAVSKLILTSTTLALREHTDHQGSVVAMHQDTGAVNTYTYDEYGDLKSGTSVQPFGYTGRRWDVTTGLYYYRARFYNPDIGRFLQVDPIGYKDDMNLYGYVGNDPINNVDPSGLDGYGFTYLAARKAGKTDAQAYKAQRNHDKWNSAGIFAGSALVVAPYAAGEMLFASPSTIELGVGIVEGATLAGPESAVIATGSSTLYRVVSSDEIADIAKAGVLRLKEGGMEIKQFITNLSDAKSMREAMQILTGNADAIIKADAPASVIKNAEKMNISDLPGGVDIVNVRGNDELSKICNVEICE